ncbi:hypothetical protein D9611_008051 [Ephemerocybe angulata]|uniref:Uncharacterized protein n=1 Tax=Ephemerocybe angulata TaxID=980116 RepID=A0A8H5BZG5_9AGAR|nr:hypothetical protein D9611_008051 [Tulosesus angulatus]
MIWATTTHRRLGCLCRGPETFRRPPFLSVRLSSCSRHDISTTRVEPSSPTTGASQSTNDSPPQRSSRRATPSTETSSSNTRGDQDAADLVKLADSLIPLVHPGHRGTVRPDNMKSWRIQIDGIPTHHFGVEGVYIRTNEEVHHELKSSNPAYAAIPENIIANPDG